MTFPQVFPKGDIGTLTRAVRVRINVRFLAEPTPLYLNSFTRKARIHLRHTVQS